MDAKEVGAALALVGKRLECKPVDDAVDMDMVEDIYTILERMSAEWIRETKRDCWKEILNEDWSRVNVVDEKEYKDVEMRLEGMKDMGD